MDAALAMHAAGQTCAKHALVMDMFNGWAGMLLHMGLLIYDCALNISTFFQGTPLMY